MNYIPAINIVMSFDADAMVEFQNTKDFGAFAKLIASKEEKRKRDLGDKYTPATHMFSNAPNSTFISLDHQYGNDGNELFIEIMDPQGNFEREMLDNSMSKMLDVNSDPIQKRIEQLQREIDLANNEKARIRREIFDTKYGKNKSEENLRELDQQTRLVDDRLAALETELENTEDLDIGEDSIALVKEQMKAYTGKMQRQVFVTYGVGTNLRDWSPVQCYAKIVEVNYRFTGEGVRKLRLKMQGRGIHPNLTAMGMSPLGITFSKGVLAKGKSSMRLFNQEGFDQEVERFMRLTQTDRPKDEIEELLGSKDLPSLHWPVVQAVEDFIRVSTGYTNVVVLLPDLDYYLGRYLSKYIKGAKWRFREATEADHKSDNILGYGAALDGLGMKLVEVNGPDSTIKGAIGENQYEYIEECESVDEINNWFEKKDYRVGLQTELVNKTILDTLKQLGEAISSKMADFPPKKKNTVPTSFMNNIQVEIDFQLIRLMFEAGMITDPNRPVLIWGDANLKEKVLYGKLLDTAAKNVIKEQIPEEDPSDEQLAAAAEKITDSDILEAADAKLAEYVHPLDQIAGLNSKFMKDSFDVAYPESWAGAFGPNYNGFDELGTDLPGDANLANNKANFINPLLKTRLPMFTFGNKNPNILSVNIDMDGQYMAALQTMSSAGRAMFAGTAGMIPEGFEGEAYRVFQGMRDMDFSDVDPETKVPNDFSELMDRYYDYDYVSGDDIENFSDWQKVFNELDPEAYKDMSDTAFYDDWGNSIGRGLSSKQKFMKFMWEAFSELYKKEFGEVPKPKMQQTSPANDPSISEITKSAKMTQIINETLLKGDIKTIPMFSLSTERRVMNKPCVIHCVEPRIHNPNDPEENLKANTAWFSGVYSMLGFKHRITKDSAESTFYVTRAGNSGLEPSRT